MRVERAIAGALALAATITLTSVAAAGSDAAKQRVIITTQAAKTTNVSPFVLTAVESGVLKSDSGKLVVGGRTGREVMREGQEVSINNELGTFNGKLGTLVVRFRSEWVGAGNGYHVATDTWKVVRGTGQYAGVTGGGRGGSVWSERTDAWSSREEGFLLAP
jgi:hypothetical protein